MPDLDLITDAAWRAGFRDDDLVTAVAVALAESGGDPRANNAGLNNNGSVDYGLWQINSVHGPNLDSIYDPYENAQWAYKVFTGRDNSWEPWSAFNNGKHLRFLDQARQAVAGFTGGKATVDANAQQGTLAPSNRRMVDPRLRAESMLAGAARAVSRRANKVGGSEFLQADPTDIREMDIADVEPITALVDEDEDPTGQNNELLRFRIADDEAAAAARANVEVEQADGAGAGTVDTGDWAGIPEVDLTPWLDKGLKRNAARGAAIARAFGFGGTIHGVGARGNASDHPHGNAIDIMVGDDREYGNQIAAYFVANAEALGVKYVIWHDRIWSVGRADEGWRPYVHPSGNTSNPTLAHRDHPHISFLGG